MSKYNYMYKKFDDMEYNRIDISEVSMEYNSILNSIQSAASFSELKDNIGKLNELRAYIETMRTLCEIRHSINTKDKFYSKENEFWDENTPNIEALNTEFYKILLSSRYAEDIKAEYGEQFFNLIKCRIKAFDKSIIPLLQIENKLMSEYTRLLASASIEFDGKVCNLSDLSVYMTSSDENVRRKSIKLHTEFFEKNEEKFDDIFDQLVDIRDKMAKKLGMKNFVELGYLRMERTDYTEKDIMNLRKLVLDKYVPIANKLYRNQASRIGKEKLDYYSEKLDFLDGNANLKVSKKELFENAKKMYKELSKETDEFFSFLIENNLYDFEAREGKAMGGYCTTIPMYKSPFIFGNFNGTVDDIDVLTHEAGHAFQMYRSRDIDMLEISFPTLDSCEIHSMSMEFFTYPWMEMFFREDVDKYKMYHFESAVKFIPYGTLVDHFQHEIYRNPSMSKSKRKVLWRNLERKYLLHRDYSDLEFLDRGGFWFRQGHIFKDPFYYIDYVLAQLCALQFKEKMEKDFEGAWRDYLKICDIGGRYSFSKMVDMAGLKNPLGNNK